MSFRTAQRAKSCNVREEITGHSKVLHKVYSSPNIGSRYYNSVYKVEGVGWKIEDSCFDSRQINEIFSCPNCSPVLKPISHLCNVYRGPFSLDVKLAKHIHLVPTLRLDAATPSLIHTCSQRAKYFAFTYICLTKYRKGGQIKRN